MIFNWKGKKSDPNKLKFHYPIVFFNRELFYQILKTDLTKKLTCHQNKFVAIFT